MCDSEHMFSCSDSSKPDNDDDDENDAAGEGDINTLARSIQNEGLTNNNIDQILKQMKVNNHTLHKIETRKNKWGLSI